MSMPELLQIMGYLVAIAVLIVTFFMWRKMIGAQEMYLEASNKFEEMRLKASHLDALLNKANEQLTQRNESLQRLEKSLEATRTRNATLSEQIDAKEQELAGMQDKMESAKEHLSAQVTALTSQLRDAERQKKDVELRFSASEQDTKAKTAQELRDATNKAREWEEKCREIEKIRGRIESEKLHLEQKFKEVDPEAVRKDKRRLAQYERLYLGMKGLREMAEERNKNWEVALRKLSVWILEHISQGKQAGKQDIPEALGPLVGGALSAVGTQLVGDEFVVSEKTPEEMSPEMTAAISHSEHEDTLGV